MTDLEDPSIEDDDENKSHHMSFASNIQDANGGGGSQQHDHCSGNIRPGTIASAFSLTRDRPVVLSTTPGGMLGGEAGSNPMLDLSNKRGLVGCRSEAEPLAGSSGEGSHGFTTRTEHDLMGASMMQHM